MTWRSAPRTSFLVSSLAADHVAQSWLAALHKDWHLVAPDNKQGV